MGPFSRVSPFPRLSAESTASVPGGTCASCQDCASRPVQGGLGGSCAPDMPEHSAEQVESWESTERGYKILHLRTPSFKLLILGRNSVSIHVGPGMLLLSLLCMRWL